MIQICSSAAKTTWRRPGLLLAGRHQNRWFIACSTRVCVNLGCLGRYRFNKLCLGFKQMSGLAQRKAGAAMSDLEAVTKSASLFQRKKIAELNGEPHGVQLQRTLGPFNLIALGIGAIIGAGLFSLTGLAAADNAGPA